MGESNYPGDLPGGSLVTRRSFIKSTGGATAAAVVAGTLAWNQARAEVPGEGSSWTGQQDNPF